MNEYQSASEIENVPAEYQAHVYFYNSPPKENGFFNISAAPSDSEHYHGEFEFLRDPSPGLDNNSMICSSSMKHLVASFHTHAHDQRGDKIPAYHPFYPSDITIDDKGIPQIPSTRYKPFNQTSKDLVPLTHNPTSSSSNSSEYSFALDSPTRHVVGSFAESPLFDFLDQTSDTSPQLRRVSTQANINTTWSGSGDSPGAPNFEREHDVASFMFSTHPHVSNEETSPATTSFHFRNPIDLLESPNEESFADARPQANISPQSIQANITVPETRVQNELNDAQEPIHHFTLIRNFTLHFQNTIRRIGFRNLSTSNEYPSQREPQMSDLYTNQTDTSFEEEDRIPVYRNQDYNGLTRPEDENEELQTHRRIRRYIRSLWTGTRSSEDSERRLFSRERRRTNAAFGSLGAHQETDAMTNSTQRNSASFFGFSRFSRGNSYN